MLLKSLSIQALHNTLSLDVRFNEEITLLVGINGSGKTSVLNAIDWLLKPDLERLALAQYESLTLYFEEKGTNYELTATKSPEKVTLSIAGSTNPLDPITVRVTTSVEADNEAVEDRYQGLTPEKHEIPMWDLLKSFSKPTVISLDRTISAESDEVHYIEVRSKIVRRRSRSRSPIAFVQEVTSSKYAEFRTKAIANDNELKAQIVMSALQDPATSLRGESRKQMTDREITQLEEKVSTYLAATIKSADVRKQVQSFFRSSRLLTRRKGGAKVQHDRLIEFVVARYQQIESLAKAFNDFEEKNALAFKGLNDYLVSINQFFHDSNKELFFDASTGKLAFAGIDSSGDRRSGQSVAYLSSGERQILVLFTFLAFASSPKSVFIVDEPELSLHPKWQSEFMDTFLRLRPDGTQLLLATHSPDIVGKYKANCVLLRASRS